MARFTIRPQQWYACQFIGDEFSEGLHAYSAIKVRTIMPMRSGKRTFRLDFYHANYPKGVRDKSYEMTTIERGSTMLLARSLQHDPARYLLIWLLTKDWLNRHFPYLEVETDDLGGWLDRNI
ncbi:MAG: hypothetical protein OEV34_14000 [Gammaproteobacteria bacterium]|jgi:hypothetical protein|nr:hypothetical protein [Gammaproteobacteria bacterium]